MFHNILERKNAFEDYQNKNLKDRNIGIFPNRLVHGFGQKLPVFPLLYFNQKKKHEKVSHDILERRNAFLNYKNKKLKTWKNWDFSKAVTPWI